MGQEFPKLATVCVRVIEREREWYFVNRFVLTYCEICYQVQLLFSLDSIQKNINKNGTKNSSLATYIRQRDSDKNQVDTNFRENVQFLGVG